MNYVLNGREIAADAEGYLLDYHDWSEELMQEIARTMGLELTSDHLTVINTVRAYYESYATTPAMRGLIALLKAEGHTNLSSSVALARLFPDGAAKSAARLAGLKKPVRCI